ncbi:TPA: RHS repeat domain-containing protein, partial [Salmonella enterica subsp. enterica serovar Wangata]
EYDADGHVIAESINGRRVEQDYDALNGRPVAWRLDGVAMSFTHGPAGRLTQWQVDGHAPLHLSHDALGRETVRRSEAGFVSGQRHGATGNLVEQWAGRLTAESGTVPQDVHRQMEYDRAYNMTRIRDGRWGETDYRYDVNDQITQAKGGVRTLPREEAFIYDVNLNIRQYGQTPNRHFEVMAFTKQAQQSGRVIKRDEDDYRYDDCGRLVEKTVLTDGFRPQRWRYRWDAQGQLSELITPQGECWTYRYDAFGRRISKRRAKVTRGIVGYDYQWRGDQLVAETPVQADGTAVVESSVYWLYEPGALTPGARYEKGQLHYVVRDHMGTPRELLTESGEVVWAQKLSVWGRSERYRFGGWNAPNDESGPGCPWRFAGQWADEESGLYYNRFRYYDSEAVQYLTPDPAKLAGGINPYGYVSNPLKYIDPLGLCKAETETIFRVQGGVPPNASRFRIVIDEFGDPQIQSGTLNISIGDSSHAQHFLDIRGGNAQVVSFEVPKWMTDFIEENAIPQVGYRTNPLNQGGLAPKIVDPTTPGKSYELPSVWGEWLQEVAIPGSGTVQ